MKEECFICAQLRDSWIGCKTCSKKVCVSCVNRIQESRVLKKSCPFCKTLYKPLLQNQTIYRQEPFAFVMNLAYSFITLFYFMEMILNDN
jgi:hypothetical protein